MKSKYYLQLALLVAFSIATTAFLQSNQSKTECSSSNPCCPKHCEAKTPSADNSDNIFYNPINRMIVTVYK